MAGIDFNIVGITVNVNRLKSQWKDRHLGLKKQWHAANKRHFEAKRYRKVKNKSIREDVSGNVAQNKSWDSNVNIQQERFQAKKCKGQRWMIVLVKGT